MKNKLLAAAFLEGFFLLIFELLAAQLLHPLFGNSYFVWLSILSVTMLASSLGYFLGGYITKKEDSFIQVFTFISLTTITVYMLSIYSINEFAFSMFNDDDLIIGVILQTMMLIFIPILFITSFSPIIIKYFTETNSGKSSSVIFFTSTLGGIISIYSFASRIY